MIEMLSFILATLSGALLGIIFFGGLWWTIRMGLLSKRPAAWFLGSLLVRSTIALAGFYWVSHRDWRRLLACLLGFLISRVLVTMLTRAPLGEGERIIKGSAP